MNFKGEVPKLVDYMYGQRSPRQPSGWVNARRAHR